jgi:hypothetical protein
MLYDKVAIISVISVSLFLTLMNQQINAQTNTSNNFTKLFEQKSISAVHVFYESPKTVVIRGEGPEFTYLGQAIDVVKQYGFSVDSVTVFTETSQPIGNTTYLTDIYTVFMSRK